MTSALDDLDLERFRFRGLHPAVWMGTASDRYAGWLGQIYTPERFARRVTRRAHTVGGKKFTEEVLPVESVSEYFEHFRVLEIDYTFYRPLLDGSGNPTSNYHTLGAYARHLSPSASVILKAPQEVTARKIRRASGFEANPAYLDAALFEHRFHGPATEILGSCFGGVIFEQEYQKKDERQEPEIVAQELDRFFESIPRGVGYHVELRTEAYLALPVFEVLERHGVGQVLSHWTWLPPLRKQFALAGERFLNPSQCVLRLMTPRNVRYEDAYALAHPFDRLVEGMMDPTMVRDAACLMHTAADRGVRANVIVNNRSGGNAPLISQALAREFLSAMDVA